MKDKIKNILADILEINIENITDDMSQDNFKKWDSLTHLRIIVALEEFFKISYTPKEIGQMYTLQKLVNITEVKIK